MPQQIPAQIAADAINNAKAAAWPNVFSGRMFAPNCPDPLLQWAILINQAENFPGVIQVYTNFGGSWVLESFDTGPADATCQRVVEAIQYLQTAVTITEYRLLSVSGGLLYNHSFGESVCMDGFPHTWEEGMTEWLTPSGDLISSVLESSIIWNLDDDQTCATGCIHPVWPTPST